MPSAGAALYWFRRSRQGLRVARRIIDIFASLHSLEGCDRSFVPPLRALPAPLLRSSACIAISIGVHCY